MSAQRSPGDGEVTSRSILGAVGGDQLPGPPDCGLVRAGSSEPGDDWLRGSRAYANGLTGEYRQHVIEYTGNDHFVINGWLREPGTKRSQNSVGFARSRVKSIDAVLAKKPLTETTHLYRVVDMNAFGIARGEDLEKIAGVDRIELG